MGYFSPIGLFLAFMASAETKNLGKSLILISCYNKDEK